MGKVPRFMLQKYKQMLNFEAQYIRTFLFLYAQRHCLLNKRVMLTAEMNS